LLFSVYTSLLPGFDGSFDLGTNTLRWQRLFLGGKFTCNGAFVLTVLSNVPGTSIIFNLEASATALLTTNGNFTMTFSGNPTNGGRWEYTVHNTGTTNAQWAFPASYYLSGSDSNTIGTVTMPPRSFTTINWEYYTGFGSPTNYVVKSITTKAAQSQVPYVGFVLYLDCSASTDFYVTLTNASTALIAFTNTPPIGQPYECELTVKQDGTGGRLYSFTNIIDFPQSLVFATTTAANRADVWRFKANPITIGRFHSTDFGTNYLN
jgi:hypothetical protein